MRDLPPPPPPPAAADGASKPPAIPPAQRAKLEAKFKEMDEDGNGQLTKAEVADALLLEEGDEVMEKLWAKADADGDGQITFEEFSKAAAAFDEAEGSLDLPGLP